MTDQFNTHPQPRTFAPSKEDVLQNLMYFFGAPVSPEKLKDYSEHHAMTCARCRTWPALASRTRLGPRDPPLVLTEARFPLLCIACLCADHFPDAYAGQNTKIRDTLNNLILKSPQSWQTSVRQPVLDTTCLSSTRNALRCIDDTRADFAPWQAGLPFFQIQGTVVEWDE